MHEMIPYATFLRVPVSINQEQENSHRNIISSKRVRAPAQIGHLVTTIQRKADISEVQVTAQNRPETNTTPRTAALYLAMLETGSSFIKVYRTTDTC